MTARISSFLYTSRAISSVRHLVLPFCAFALAGAFHNAQAQAFKPGLWETNNKMGGGGGKLQGALAMAQQHLANMDPEQRKQIEGMMSRQGVVIGHDGVVAKMCITPEMAARQQLPIQQHGNCSYQHERPVGDTMAFSFSCTNPKANGEGSATFAGPTAYTSTMRVTTDVTGASETVNIASSGRWLGADCGAVQPIILPAKK
ncbi:DUF3617 domain-containing protein [Massilia psychrophila]|uniref:DUF3617 domain-containing protein n=1 Tax=Massilia psychrophila TaxID=1603353 RepID=A0A2G8SY24_9BURK|nr:DUF3617 domain-containing protein [Massilia psychrophila]PIL38613.1 hypothetical protein CR103_17010 [Massilia psychrophila]GGE69540.1 hypothetical protein GCM10008020_12530 [Massilia psychrophila]